MKKKVMVFVLASLNLGPDADGRRPRCGPQPPEFYRATSGELAGEYRETLRNPEEGCGRAADLTNLVRGFKPNVLVFLANKISKIGGKAIALLNICGTLISAHSFLAPR